MAEQKEGVESGSDKGMWREPGQNQRTGDAEQDHGRKRNDVQGSFGSETGEMAENDTMSPQSASEEDPDKPNDDGLE